MTALVYGLGVVLFFIGVCVSIALHEVGHMVTAKAFGVKVTQYFVGFGRTVWSRKWGETEYGIKTFPLGGFVKMIGMLPPEKRDATGNVRGFRGPVGRLIAEARFADRAQVDDADEDRVFYRKPSWKKLIVMAAGPATNLLLAVVLLGSVFMILGIASPTLKISQVSDCVQPASAATAVCRPKDPVSPARKAGFHAGDVIKSVDGTPMRSWDQFSHVIRDSRGKQLAIVVERGGTLVTLHADPTVNSLASLNDPDKIVHAGFLGVSPVQVRERQSIGYVFSTIGDYTAETGKALVKLPGTLVGVAKSAVGLQPRSADSPMSVVGASRVAGQVASDSQIGLADRIATLLMLLGVVNLFVALFNFVPLLPLDGGHMAGAIYEAVRRAWARLLHRPDPGYADVAQMLPIAYAAAAVLIVLGALLVWADIVAPINLTG